MRVWLRRFHDENMTYRESHNACGVFCVFCIKSKENKTMAMNQLSIQLQAPYSEERRRKASESAKQTGFKRRTE